MSLHNPAAVPDSLVGPNHKLLSTEDLDKPLPEGAEYWYKGEWCVISTTRTDETLTYRIPLSLSDRLRSERDKIDELIPIMEAVENGAEWDFQDGLKWEPSITQSAESLYALIKYNPDRKVRLKPTPRSIPWTLETHPDVACVMPKDCTEQHVSITRWWREGAYVDGFGWVTYEDLHSDWLQRNGQPAGQEVQG